jgi:phenylalanyl-tRNA synthetase beta chain
VRPGDQPFLHPGRAGRVLVSDEDVGWLGEIHPLVCREWDLDAAAGFEVDLAPLVAASPIGEEAYDDVISYPAVHQDIAVVVDEAVPASGVLSAVLEGGGELLRSAEVFDLPRRAAGEGRKPGAPAYLQRPTDLTDEVIASLSAASRRGGCEADVGAAQE